MTKQGQQTNHSTFIKCLVLVVILTLLGGAGMYGLAKHRQHTSYVATRSLIISHEIRNQAENRNDNNPDISMMPTYRNVIEDPMVGKMARQYLPKKLRKKYSSDDISNMIKTHVSDQSLVMEVKVQTDSRKDSVKVVNAVTRAFKKDLPQVQPGAGQVRLMAPATKSSTSANTTPHAKKYVAVGLAFGCLVGLIISFLYITWSKLL